MNKLASLLMSARPWSFFLSLASVTTGSVVAYAAGSFHLGRFIVVEIGGVSTRESICSTTTSTSSMAWTTRTSRRASIALTRSSRGR